ncbi:MAG: signal peptidase I [Actinomycetota bacterium]|nr:signal peptidase I [Actinomycetota bacterium]
MCCAAIAVGASLLHVRVSPVLTSSMTPTFRAGAAVLTRPTPVEQLRPGMVAVFVPPGESDPFAHRIVSVTATGSGRTLVTKGDANPALDEWRAQLSETDVPVVITSVPTAGWLLVWGRHSAVRAFALAGVGIAFAAIGVRLMFTASPPLDAPSPA